MTTSEAVEEVLAHFGVKGMRWGVRRKATVGPQEVIVSDKRKKIKTSGGEGHPAHSSAVLARTLGQKGKKSGLKSLSDEELRVYANRLQLEQNVKRLNFNEKNAGQKFVLKMLGKQGTAVVDEGSRRVGRKALGMALAGA
jgi:hypothetical protein